MKRTFSSRNMVLAIVLFLATGAFAMLKVGAGSPPADGAPKSWYQTRAGQLVFFAVLEGLYRDGVSNADVDLIIPPDARGRPRFDPDHFVYACPLCHPGFEAFRLYRQREPLFGLKAQVDSFGPGLDESVRAKLRSPDATARREAIQGLISRWVGQRLEMMRLSAAERAAITSEMAAGRKAGMNMLKADDPAHPGRTNCPICDGSFGACQLVPH